TEFDLDGLAPGVPFRFSCAAWPGRNFSGAVRVVGAGLDPATHTVQVRGDVLDSRHELKPEMFVSVDVPRQAIAGTSVPAAAVYLHGDRHFVFVEQLPGCFTRREVTLGAEDADRVVVTAGVRAGERVVSDGAILLQQLLD